MESRLRQWNMEQYGVDDVSTMDDAELYAAREAHLAAKRSREVRPCCARRRCAPLG